MISTLWNKIAASFRDAPAPPLENCALHYVWISRKPAAAPANNAAPLCAVPLHYLDKAFENAQAYPETPVTIWADFALLDDMSRFFTQSHIYNSAPGNVTLRDLNDIPSYAEDALFKPGADGKMRDIWARVDYARLLVLRHAFGENEAQNNFYADFDIEDVKLADPRIARIMNKYGMFFTLTDEKYTIIENSFMGISRGERGERFLKDYLIPVTETYARRDKNGYLPLIHQMSKWLKDTETGGRRKKLGISLAHPSGFEMWKNPLYKNLGIN